MNLCFYCSLFHNGHGEVTGQRQSQELCLCGLDIFILKQKKKQLRFTAIHYNEQLVCFWDILDEQYLVCLVWFFSSWVQLLQTGHELIRLIHGEDHLYMEENRAIQTKCQTDSFKFMYLEKCFYPKWFTMHSRYVLYQFIVQTDRTSQCYFMLVMIVKALNVSA